MLVPPVDEPIAPARNRGVRGSLAFVTRNRLQLLGALAIAVLLPALLRHQVPFIDGTIDSASATTVGTALAVIFGAYVLRRVSAYPGAQALAYVVPSFAAVFAAVVVVFFFARIDYSRVQFLMSFALAVSWYMLALRVERRIHRPSFLVLPFGNATSLLEWSAAEWRVARSPKDKTDSFTGVVTDLRADMEPDWQRMLADAALRGVPVYHSKQLSEALTGRVQIEHLSENNLGSLLPSRIYFRIKRLLDIGLAIIVLPFALLIMTAVALAIRIKDGGPVFFRQERLGFRGETFTVIKFRTMRTEAEDGDDRHFTVDGDPRVTSLGRWLRRCRVDELPQIINILRGEMSWIGPRPEALPLSEWYESKIPFYSYRHIVRPGISGWAAVNQGNVAEIDAATSKLQYDFYYIKHFSLWLDLLIFGKTFRTVLTGFGAK